MTERSDSSASHPDAGRPGTSPSGQGLAGGGGPHLPAPTLHRVIGIDLGTTTCAVALWDGARVVVLPPVAAVVALDGAGRVIVGRTGADPETAIAGVKRSLGSTDKIRFRGRDYQPQEICAFILIELKRQAETLTGESVHDAVITVPPTYGDRERRAITEAAGLAQLNVRRLLDEPTAAAVAVGASRSVRSGAGVFETGIWGVYDLGGGTFDASVVSVASRTAVGEVEPGRVGVLAGGGDPRLGGDDFDERIVAYALRQIRERYHVDLSRDTRIRARIRGEAEIRKRELSTAEATTLELPSLTATVDASVPLTRRAFEAMIEADLDRTFACLGAVFDEAEALFGVNRADLDGVLLVGASTRIPMLGERLARHFGLPRHRVRAADPDSLVARGAGLVARQYPESAVFEGNPIGLRSAGLRLRSEMALSEPARPEPARPGARSGPTRFGPTQPDPLEPTRPDPLEPAQPDPLEPALNADTGPPRRPPRPPAETPADFRPVAQAAYELLIPAPGEFPVLRAAYASFVAAIQSAATDRRLDELGHALAQALVSDRAAADRCP